ncbi:uncharacterized protein LOC116178026 isoform X2 [Photinus pyralis]|uniref:MYND-type domain-containing protein n=1 Tax=Photinus pyralis TaxID=7054 RepID=A0A1Y1LVR1_PHOPY|nr:uncharacterized protein LOC116178026 isoform X2 [Photinus pyralis]
MLGTVRNANQRRRTYKNMRKKKKYRLALGEGRVPNISPNMDDRRNEVQDDMHRKPERNDQNWRARGWKESYCRWYNRKGYHLDDVWRENYDDDDGDDDNKNNNIRCYPNQQCTFYNRNPYGSYSHNNSSYQNYMWTYGTHQLRPELYRNSSSRSRGNSAHSNNYRSNFSGYGPRQNTPYSSNTAQRRSSSNSNAPARDSCNNILDDNLLVRLHSLHDTNNVHVTMETDLPNLEEPVLNLSEVINGSANTIAGSITDTHNTPVPTKRYNTINLSTINTNGSYLHDFHGGSSLKQTDNVNLGNSTSINETEQPVYSNENGVNYNASGGGHQLHEDSIVESEAVDQSPNNGDHSSNQEHHDYDLSFFNDSLEVETEVIIDICGDVDDTVGQCEQLIDPILHPAPNDLDKNAGSVPDNDSIHEQKDGQTTAKDSDADESESLSQIIDYINSTALNCAQACATAIVAPNSVSMEQLDQSLMDVDNITSTSQTSAKVVNQGSERILAHEKSSDKPEHVQKQSTATTHSSCENVKKLTEKSFSAKPPCRVSHRRKTCTTHEEAKKVADPPVKRLKMTEEPESNANDVFLDKKTSHNGSKHPNKPSKIHKRRKTIAAEWVICGSYQNASELKEHNQKKSNKPPSDECDQITIYDRHGEFAFVSSVAKYESLSSDQGKEKVAPVRIVKRRNTVAVEDFERANRKHTTKSRIKITKENDHGSTSQAIDVVDSHKHLKEDSESSSEALQKQIQTRRKSIPISLVASKEVHASKQSTKPRDVGRRPSSGGLRTQHAPSEDRNGATKKKEHLMELRVHLPKLPDENVMIPLKEYVPPTYAKSSKKAPSRNSKFIQLFGPDSDDDSSSQSSKRLSRSKSSKRSIVDRMPWKLKKVDDYMLNMSIKHGQDSTCDDVFETVVEFNVEGMDKLVEEVAKRNETKIELKTAIVTQMAVYSDTVIARQDCNSDTEMESIKEINNLMQLHCPSNNAIDAEQLVCVPDILHQEQFQQPPDVVMACSSEEVQSPPEPVLLGKPGRGRGRGRGRSRGRGNRKITPLRNPPSMHVPSSFVSPTRSSTQAANVQAITYIEFCETLWECIFYNVKNCEMLVKQTNSYNKIKSVKIELALKPFHQTRENEVEELARFTLNFLRRRTIHNFAYKEFLRSCYNYGGRRGMRITLPALVKFLFSVVQKIKEIEKHLEGFVLKFCSEVESEYENSVRWLNIRDDFIFPTFPRSPPPPYVRANSEAEVTTTPVSVANACCPAARSSCSPVNASSTSVIVPSSTASVSSPPMRSSPNCTPPINTSTVDLTTTEPPPTTALVVKPPVKDRTTHRLGNAVLALREIELPPPEPQYGFTLVQRHLLNLQILQYCELHSQLLESTRQQQQPRELSHYYSSSSGFPRRAIGENGQTYTVPPLPGLSTNPLNHNAEFYSSNANPNVSQTSHTNPLINDNFRIRLPLLVPHNQVQITHVTPPSTPEIVATETPAPVLKRSASPISTAVVPPSAPVVQPIKEEATPTKPTVIKTNNSPSAETANPSDSRDNEQDVKPVVEPITVTFEDDEVIDVDRWFVEKMKQSDFIDLDDYDMPNADPDEEDVKVEEPAQNLIVHSTLLEVERICICSKRATLLCLCGLAIYCSLKCQTDDWCNHANICASTRERKNT